MDTQSGKKNLRPRWDVDPRQKDNGWILQEVKANIDHWEGVSTRSFAKGADRYHTNRLYSRDQQSVAKYQERYSMADDPNGTYLNLNWEPMPVMSKFRRIIEEKIGKRIFRINAQSIDPQAVAEKDKYERREKANIEVRNELSALGVDTSVLNTGEVDQPMDLDALAMKMEFDWKHNDAIDIEKRIKAVFELERIEEIRRVIRRDVIETGAMAIKDWTEDNGEVKLKPGDISCMGISPTKDPMCQDIWYVFEEVLMSASEVQRKANLTKNEVLEIVERYKSKYGNNSRTGAPTLHNKGWYDEVKVPVICMTFKTTNRTVWETRKDKRGNKIIGRVGVDSERHADRSYRVDDKNYWYEAKWVKDSDVIFDAGPCKNQKRKASRKWDSIPGWTIIIPELYDMETTSIIDNCRPLIDNIYHAGIKLQNVIARARPTGMLIEIGALEDVSLDGSETTMSPLALADMLESTGNLYYRLEGIDGETRNWRPIEELRGGLGQEAQEHFAVINNYFQYLRDMLGFNDITDGTTPDSRTLNGVAALAEQGTNNAINFVAEAERLMLERVADSVAIRVYDSINIQGSKFYENILGTKALKDIKEDPGKAEREFSIIIEDEPDPLEVQDLNMSLEKAIDNGQITAADKYRIKGVQNIKQAQQLLAYSIKKREEKMHENAMAAQDKNIQDQQQSAQIAHQFKLKEIQVEQDLILRNQNNEWDRKDKHLQIEKSMERETDLAVQGLKNEDNSETRSTQERISREKAPKQEG